MKKGSLLMMFLMMCAAHPKGHAEKGFFREKAVVSPQDICDGQMGIGPADVSGKTHVSCTSPEGEFLLFLKPSRRHRF